MTDKLKRSRVFPGTKKPWMNGVYERNYADCIDNDDEEDIWLFCLFCDGQWMNSYQSVEDAMKGLPSGFQSLPWRGLATRDGK